MNSIVAVVRRKKKNRPKAYVFMTKNQGLVENEMLRLGYGCRDFILDFAEVEQRRKEVK